MMKGKEAAAEIVRAFCVVYVKTIFILRVML